MFADEPIHQSADAIAATEPTVTRTQHKEEIPKSTTSFSARSSSRNADSKEEGVTVLSGRILNLEGVVAKNKTLKARVQYHSASVDEIVQYSLRTDKDGRFRHVFYEGVSLSSVKKFWVITGKSSNRLRRIASVDFLEPLPEGIVELGDLVVKAPPVLLEGTVVDETGNGIPGATLVLKRSRHSDDSVGAYDKNGRNSNSRDMEISFVFFGEEGPWWEDLSDLNVESDENGWFQIRGEAISWTLRLEARHRDFVDAEIEVELGERDVQFSLMQSGSIQGRFLLDKPLRGKPMTIWMEFEGRPSEGFGTGLGWDGRFSFSDITPGVVHLSLKSNFTNEVLFEWRDFLVPSEAPVVQLPEIDLRGQLYAMALKVVDVKGRAVKNAKIQLSSMDRSEGVRNFPLSLVSKEPFLSMSVGAEGMKTQHLSNVSGNQIVRLKEGHSARIVIDNFSEVKKTTIMSMLFIRDGADEINPSFESFSEDIDRANGTIEYVFSESGIYELKCYFIEVDPDSREWTMLLLDENTIRPMIEIKEVDTLQTFYVSLDIDALQRSHQNL